MTAFTALIRENRLDLGSDLQRTRFAQFCKENQGAKVRIELISVESNEMRRYFEGGIIAALCEYHENFDRRNPDDRRTMRELVKEEFLGVLVPGLHGEPVRVARSSKGRKELRELLERVTEYMQENGIPVPDPALFKKWRDEYSFEHPDFYDWLAIHKLRPDGSFS